MPELAVVQPEKESGADTAKFRTHLKLKEEREKWLVDRALQRITEVSREMGLEPDGRVVSDSWMGHRHRHQLTYDNDLDWRKGELGGVFQESNLTLGTNKRYVREMSAKVVDDLVGTTPFFGAVKKNSSDDPEGVALAKGIEEFVQGKIALSNLQEKIGESQFVALVRNEAVVKIRNRYWASPFWGPATVLAGRNGDPITTPAGLLVYEGDDFLPDPNVKGLFRLRKDPAFAMKQGEFQYREFDSLRQEIVHCDGVEAGVLDYRSFLCPLRVATTHEADINVHLYEATPEQLSATYGGFEMFERYMSTRGTGTTGELQPRRAHGEHDDDDRSTVLSLVPMAEVYIRADADEDGYEEEILLVLDLRDKRAVFYEYLANQMKKRPFEVIVGVEAVPSRWYGVGIMHMMFDTGMYIDSQFNRYNIKDSKTASVTFRDPMAVKEWKAGLPTILGGKEIYDVEPGYDDKTRPPIWRVNLQEVSEIGLKLMEKMEQSGNLQFGVISAKDASVSNMNQSRTATGILNLERAANILTKSTETAQKRGIEALLNQAVDIILENMRPMELFFSSDGQVLHSINREEARTIDRDVQLLLTRSRSTELLATNQQALQIAKEYHALRAQDPQTARDLRDLYVNQLKGLEVMDADKLLPEVTDADLKAWQASRANAPKVDPSMRELMNYKDSPPSIKRQMEEQAGFTPATEAESQEEAAEAAQTGAA